jgi:hypothetical protein
MTLIVVDQAEEHFLDLILAVNYTVKLYKNNVTSGLTQVQKDALTQASFTEATFTGYSAANLTGGSWTTTAGNPCVGTYAAQSFTSSANQAQQTLYGYYVTRTSDGKLEWFEDFVTPLVIEFDGEFIRITPRITLQDTGD